MTPVADLVQRVDLSLGHPAFRARLLAMLADLAAQGVDFWLISLYRPYPEQGELYAQGRTAPGLVVTDAKPGDSSHNFGCAGDLCRDGFVDRRGLQPDWRNESYEPLRLAAPKHGLIWGGTYRKPDRPHLNLPGLNTAAELKPVREAYERGGLLAAWAVVDSILEAQDRLKGAVP